MTYDTYSWSIVIFGVVFIIFMMGALIHSIMYVGPHSKHKQSKKHKIISAITLVIFFTGFVGLLLYISEYPEYASFKECKDIPGTLTLVNEMVGTKTNDISTTYCRRLYDEGWTDWVGYEPIRMD